MRLRSFDIFDTLVTRDLAGDDAVYRLLGTQIRELYATQLPTSIALNFGTIRKEAQTLAHAHASHPEIQLEEIYDAIAARYPEVDTATLQKIQQLEEDLEVQLCYGIEENIAQVLELLADEERVILISDMYLPMVTIQAILDKAAPALAQLPIYLSSEIRRRKADGDLYRYVAEKESVEPQAITHTGDNYHSDYTMAKRMGLNAVLYTRSSHQSIEAAYLNDKTGITARVYAGASRKARLRRMPSETTTSYTLGATFSGPFFLGFTLWALQRAAALGIQDIYFLARDGHILLELAKKLKARVAPELRLHYLYISRKSTLLASVIRLTDRSLDWAFEEMDNIITLRRVAERLGCKLEELEVLLNTEEPPPPDKRLSYPQTRLLRDAILNDNAMREQIEAQAAKARHSLKGYLLQNGIDGKSPIALVDVGWKCSIQDGLYRMLSEDAGTPHIEGFYFGCSHFSDLTSARNNKHPYLITPSNLPGPGPILELLLMAPHGTTLGYAINANEQYEPILKAYNPTSESWDMAAYFDGIRTFVEKLLEIWDKYPGLQLQPEAIDQMLLEMLEDPQIMLSESLGDLPYCGDQEESNPRAMAPRFNLANACKYLLGGRSTRSKMTQWYQASYKRSGLPARFILALDPRKPIFNLVRKLASQEKQLARLRAIRKMLKI